MRPAQQARVMRPTPSLPSHHFPRSEPHRAVGLVRSQKGKKLQNTWGSDELGESPEHGAPTSGVSMGLLVVCMYMFVCVQAPVVRPQWPRLMI